MFSAAKGSVALRLTLFYALFFGIVTAGGGILLYHLVRIHLLEEIDQDLLRQQQGISSILAAHDSHALKTELASSTADGGREDYFVRILDAEGRVELSSDLRAWRVPLPSIPTDGLEIGQHTYLTVEIPDARRQARVLTSAVAPGRYLQIGLSLADSMAFLRHFQHYGLIILGTMLSLGTLAGWALARKAMAGVEAVTGAADRIADGHFSDRVRVVGQGREIDHLVHTFNRMAEHVQTVMAEMRQVNDHIAHDLRSPLTRIRGLAENAAIQAAPGSERAELAGSIVEECDRLGQMINTMLEIAEAEAGVQRLALTHLEPAALVAQALELYEGVADERGIALSSDLQPTPSLEGDRRRLLRALANLIDNALKYTPAGGRVEVSLAHKDNGVEIAVRDSGPGIPAADVAHLFERFYRGDRSRHLPGNGLGLSLARAVAHAHGGEIRVESHPGEGSTFVLSLPLTPG
ncbi:MAG: ATP-binding protein [Gallionellaceae bacterium]|nr:ATP-binding protein [Gallionellaceae bacterium]